MKGWAGYVVDSSYSCKRVPEDIRFVFGHASARFVTFASTLDFNEPLLEYFV